MKKNILLLLGFVLVASLCIAAGPQSSDPTIYLDTAAQALDEPMNIKCVMWVSDQGTNKDIAADDDFLLVDTLGSRIVGKRAEAAGDGIEVCFGDDGFPVNGINASVLDGGVVYVIRKRR